MAAVVTAQCSLCALVLNTADYTVHRSTHPAAVARDDDTERKAAEDADDRDEIAERLRAHYELHHRPHCDRVAQRYHCPSRRMAFSVLVQYCTWSVNWHRRCLLLLTCLAQVPFTIPLEGSSLDTPFSIGLGEKAKNSAPAIGAPDSFAQMS